MAFQFRRGTDAERQSITPKAGEPLFVTDTGKVYVGNGTAQGGLLVSAAVSDDDSPSLGGNLDLNNNNIIGTGNINIDGTITATGSINLGDGVEDNIIVGGVIGSNLIPDTDGLYDLGSSDFFWRKGFFEDIAVDGELSANSLQINSIELDDSTRVFDGETNSLFVSSIEGDLKGSVFGDDSSVIVDSVNNTLSTGIITIENQEISAGSGNTVTVVDGLIITSTLESTREGISLIGAGTTTSTSNIVRFETSGGNIGDQAQANTVISSVESRSYNGNVYLPSAIQAVITTDVADPAYPSVPSSILWFTGDGVNTITDTAPTSLTSQGIFNAPVIKLSSYTDTEFPTSPEEGWMIFDTTNKEFKGYNGTTWVTLG